ncbi:hypothetical protein HYE67_000102 [Fusarium culmorum]|uniref:EXPERA domain-containing protein n=1 Tax=Fusarium culmorum TaxID=5516 RepID=A0A2T4GC76_FUSCU|nr:hypothetical protein FCULG_00012728 [Fusarium culmorum]QPC57871.1 hypothetical protein HYE67_000102 [Fusarium culmorum]
MTHVSEILPWHYQFAFMIFEPSVIFATIPLIPASPIDHFHSLAPADSAGPFWSPSLLHGSCDAASAWNTPQLRGLWYAFMSALAFSGVIEPLLLYVARYKLRDIHDAEQVIKAVLFAFMAFDVFHAGATLAVTGVAAALPGPRMNVYVMINVWIPTAWLLLRTLWMVGIARKSSINKTVPRKTKD